MTNPTPRFGPTLQADGQTHFALWAPSVEAVSLHVTGASPVPMQAAADGWFEITHAAAPGDSYGFILPDGMRVPDPAARAQAGDGVHGASLLVDPLAYAWRNTQWRNRPWQDAVIYEIHPAAFGGFTGIIGHLRRLADLGVTAIELMPIADFPGIRNWGYDGVQMFAPSPAYGTPDELKALVDAAHGAGLMVFLDVVYNHFGSDGAYIHVYANSFFDEGVHTPWGAAIDFKKSVVRDYYLQNALMWLNEFRFDGLRFDAVHAISPQDVLPFLAQAIRAGADHPVHLVIEHEGNRAPLLQGPQAGLFDAQWADDWHHCMHVLLTGEQEGYYEDFPSPAEQLATAMAEGFVYQGQMSQHQGAPRGEPSGHLPPDAFVVCLQNHDQIGNRALGERLTALADPQAMDAATALLLLSPSIPLLFMGQDWGTRAPFLFFTDHNTEMAELIRRGRATEFAHFAAFKDPARRAQIPDPNAAETFDASVPDAAELDRPDHARIQALHRTLLDLRHAHVVPGIQGATSTGARALGARAVIGQWRLGNETLLTLAANFADTPMVRPDMPGRLLFCSQPDPADGALPAYCTLATLAQAA